MDASEIWTCRQLDFDFLVDACLLCSFWYCYALVTTLQQDVQKAL